MMPSFESTTSATERPWRLERGKVIGNDDSIVAALWTSNMFGSTAVANAALLLAAVNSYHPDRDALLAEAAKVAEDQPYYHDMSDLATIRAALEEAHGWTVTGHPHRARLSDALSALARLEAKAAALRALKDQP